MGVWKKDFNYFQIIPNKDGFEIKWGQTYNPDTRTVTGHNRIIIKEATETYNRILAKAKQGYIKYHSLDTVWNDKCYIHFDNISDVVKLSEIEFKKRKPRRKKIGILDWLAGMSDVREDEDFENIS